MGIQKQHEDFDLWWEGNAIAMMCEEDEALKIWQAAKAQAVPEGYCVVPIESLEESLDWAGVAKWDSPNSARDEEINKHEEVIRAIVEAQEQNQ